MACASGASSGQGVRMARRRSNSVTGSAGSSTIQGSRRKIPSELRPILRRGWLPSMPLVSFVRRKSLRTRRGWSGPASCAPSCPCSLHNVCTLSVSTCCLSVGVKGGAEEAASAAHSGWCLGSMDQLRKSGSQIWRRGMRNPLLVVEAVAPSMSIVFMGIDSRVRTTTACPCVRVDD